ncbi:basic salivary proline-rich protein 2-like [Cygnus olor]|uniref:basic salivary proline-rich protein 2-like n=1 Tax=Cygnus olor TaxID=8869 RepID=UPI001ADE85CF|nr:basic salivary proline-rich protein 2-like [Cygnus olor]
MPHYMMIKLHYSGKYTLLIFPPVKFANLFSDIVRTLEERCMDIEKETHLKPLTSKIIDNTCRLDGINSATQGLLPGATDPVTGGAGGLKGPGTAGTEGTAATAAATSAGAVSTTRPEGLGTPPNSELQREAFLTSPLCSRLELERFLRRVFAVGAGSALTPSSPFREGFGVGVSLTPPPRAGPARKMSALGSSISPAARARGRDMKKPRHAGEAAGTRLRGGRRFAPPSSSPPGPPRRAPCASAQPRGALPSRGVPPQRPPSRSFPFSVPFSSPIPFPSRASRPGRAGFAPRSGSGHGNGVERAARGSAEAGTPEGSPGPPRGAHSVASRQQRHGSRGKGMEKGSQPARRGSNAGSPRRQEEEGKGGGGSGDCRLGTAGQGPVPPAQGVVGAEVAAAAAGLIPPAERWGRRPAPPGGPTPSGCPPAGRAAAERTRWAGQGWAGPGRLLPPAASLPLPFSLPGAGPSSRPIDLRAGSRTRRCRAVPGRRQARRFPPAATTNPPARPHYLARPRLTRRCRVPLAAAPASARPAPPPAAINRWPGPRARPHGGGREGAVGSG